MNGIGKIGGLLFLVLLVLLPSTSAHITTASNVVSIHGGIGGVVFSVKNNEDESTVATYSISNLRGNIKVAGTFDVTGHESRNVVQPLVGFGMVVASLNACRQTKTRVGMLIGTSVVFITL